MQDAKLSSKARLNKVIWQKLRGNASSLVQFYDISRRSKLLPKLKPRDMVHPQLETLEFYSKYQTSDVDYVPESSRVIHKQSKERVGGQRRIIKLKDILENFKEGQLSFVGQAGSGKTTLLRSITRDIIEGRCENFSEDQVVHFVNLRTFTRQDLVTPAELLFRNVVPAMSDSEMSEAMQFAKQNPEKVLFVIDALDTIPYTIDGVYTSITTEALASPEAILYHLLAGKLLPGCRFITSSREFAIRNYKGDVQAKLVIALAGLTKESMRKIVVGYLKEKEAKKIMTFLKSKPVIESLCRTPLWLVFTLMALKMDSHFMPSTMTSILVIVLQSMIRSEHVHQENIEIALDKLSMMAFTGTTQHRVEFSKDELGDFGLALSEIIDLIIITPSGEYQRLIFGDSILIYAHQCLQEILTAFHIAKMEFGQFKAFIVENVNKPHFAIVRRLLTGILLNEEVFEEAENFIEKGRDFEEKKLFLEEIFKKQLQSTSISQEDQLELYLSLSEGGDALRNIVQENIHEFKFIQMSLSPSEMYSIGWVMSQQSSVEELNLSSSNPTADSLSALFHVLEGSNVKVKFFDVVGNGLGPSELALIAKISKQCKVDKLEAADLKSEALKSFLDFSVGLILEEFHLAKVEFTPEETILIAKISRQCKVDILTLPGSRWKSEALESFLDSSAGLKVRTLNLGCIQCMDNTAGTIAGRIIRKRGVESLVIGHPDYLSMIDVEAFRFSSTEYFKLAKLTCDNFVIFEKPIQEVIQKVHQFFLHVLKEIVLTAFVMEPAYEKILQDILDEGNNKDLKISYSVRTEDIYKLVKKTLISRKSVENYSPSMVENRRAELNDDVIAVSWYFPGEGCNVEYHVETFCNDQSTGDIKVCNEPLCKIGELRASAAYCFKIWAVDSSRIAGQAMFTNEVVSCPLPVRNLHLVFIRDKTSDPRREINVSKDEIADHAISKAFSEEITVEGGTITVGGCSITFHPGTFIITTKVTGKVQLDSRKWPSNYTGITALFYIHPENNLCIPAVVRMKSWCAPGLSKEGKAVMAHVLHYREDIESWEVIEKIPLNDEYTFQFECKNFSPIQVAIPDDQCDQGRFLLESKIYTQQNTFCVVSFLRDELLRTHLREEMADSGFRQKMTFSPILVMVNDNIRFLLMCAAPPGFSFPSNEPLNFIVGENFLRKKYSLMNAVLKKTTTKAITERLEMWGRIVNGDQDLLDGPHSFYYEWEELAQVPIRLTQQSSGLPTTSRLVGYSAEAQVSEAVQRGNVVSRRPGSSGIQGFATQTVGLSGTLSQQYVDSQALANLPGPGTSQIQGFDTRTVRYGSTNTRTPSQQYIDSQAFANLSGHGTYEMQGFGSETLEYELAHRGEPSQQFVNSQTFTNLTAPGSSGMQGFGTQTVRYGDAAHPGTPSQQFVDSQAFTNLPVPGTSGIQGLGTQTVLGLAHTVPPLGPFVDLQAFANLSVSGPHVGPIRTGLPGRYGPPSTAGHPIHPVQPRHMQTLLRPEACMDPRFAERRGCYAPHVVGQLPHIGEELHSSQSQIGPAEHPSQLLGHLPHPVMYQETPRPLQATSSLRSVETETIPKPLMDVSRASRNPQTPPELSEPVLVVQESRIQVLWDAPEDTDRLTYCVNIYCNDQLCENMPLRTRNTYVEYVVKPSSRYSCQVWAVNSSDVEGRKTWSDSVRTPDAQRPSPSFQAEERREAAQVQTLVSGSAGSTITFHNSQIFLGGAQQQQPVSSVSTSESTTRSIEPSGTQDQDPLGRIIGAAALTSSGPSGASGGQRAFFDATAAVTNVQVRRSTHEAYNAHFHDGRIYTIEEHRRKGKVLIINNAFRRTESWREGSEVDVKNLEKLWRKMGFEVETRLNLTAQHMLYSCRQFAQRTRDVNVVVIIIMSHGKKAEDGKEYFSGEDWNWVCVDDIIFYFTSNEARHLRGIPKLFLFQACRGRGVDVVADAETEVPEMQPLRQGPFFPERVDMLITFPTQSGNKALRNRFHGSWHMNAITRVFMHHAHDTHVLDMLTMVNAEVAKKITGNCRIQISNQLNFFTKNLYLFPGWPN